MDTNYIRKDGFSNPATERLFRANWEEGRMHAFCSAGKHCGLCIHSHLLIDVGWHFCLNEDSKYFLETGPLRLRL